MTSVAMLVERVRELAVGQDRVLIGIDGCGGAGKSTLAETITTAIPNSAVICGDDFRKPVAQCPGDLINSGGDYDWHRLQNQVIDPFHRGEVISYQRYDWESDQLAERRILRESVVVIEGVYVLHRELRDLYDLKVWVDCPRHVCLRRGLERDGEAMRSTWEHVWMPAEDFYVRAQKPAQCADFVVDGTEAWIPR